MSTSSERVRIPSYVHFTAVDDGYIVADLRGGHYFSLDESASIVWEILSQGGPLDEAADRLTKTYIVDQETARADVHALVNQLIEAGLIERTQPTTSSG